MALRSHILWPASPLYPAPQPFLRAARGHSVQERHMHRRSSYRSIFLSLVAFALLAPGIALAQPQDYSVLIDSDNSDATGCTVGSPPEAFLGADYRVVTTVNTSVDPPLVTNIELEVCTAAPSTWSPFAGPDPFTEFPTPFPAPTDGIYDAIESYVPLAILASGP